MKQHPAAPRRARVWLAVFTLVLVSLTASSFAGRKRPGSMSQSVRSSTMSSFRAAAAKNPRRVPPMRAITNKGQRRSGNVTLRYPLHRIYNAKSEAYARVRGNSRQFKGPSHVYIIRRPDGSLQKVGISAKGVRKRDGASKRAEGQARKLTRKHRNRGGVGSYTTEIIRWTPGTDYSLAYEKKWRDTYRRIFGTGKKDTRLLPGNREHRSGN